MIFKMYPAVELLGDNQLIIQNHTSAVFLYIYTSYWIIHYRNTDVFSCFADLSVFSSVFLTAAALLTSAYCEKYNPVLNQ